MQKKITIAISIVALCVTFFSGTAQAITGITSDLVPNKHVDGIPYIIRNKNEAGYTFELTAENPVGQITWYGEETNHDTGDVHPFQNDAQTGNTMSFSLGKFVLDTYFTCIIRAIDSGATGENASREYKYVVQNANYTGNIENPHFVLSQDNTVPTKLNQAIIFPVVLSDEVIARLAQNISVDPSEIILLTSADFTTSEPPEPTNAMRQRVQSDNGQFMAKLNTINVSRDGWYVFMVTVSDDLVGTKVSDLCLYGAEASDFTASSAGSVSAAFDLLPMANGLTGTLEISNLFGVKLDTLPKQFLATMFLSASKSITVYIVKIIIMLLTGCDTGIGIIGGGLMIVAGGAFIAKCIKRKRH